MKKLKTYFILLLLFGFTTAYAQGTQSATTENDRATKSLEDPKLSPEEQALMLTAGEDNPAKIDKSTQVDPKLTPDEQALRLNAGKDNPAKTDESTQVDHRANIEPALEEKQATSDPGTQPISGNTQPAGEEIGTIPNYRDIQGSGEQPAGDTPVNIENYRDMQGSGKQQPGDTPEK